MCVCVCVGDKKDDALKERLSFNELELERKKDIEMNLP